MRKDERPTGDAYGARVSLAQGAVPMNQLDRLKGEGFDKSYWLEDEDGCAVRCSQCEALVVNSVATHERGCPNAWKKKENDDG